jgi:tripartite-type tricarboxylate transporter receptor subunit TctC
MVLFPHVYKKLDYDAVKDFTPISQIASVPVWRGVGPGHRRKERGRDAGQGQGRPQGCHLWIARAWARCRTSWACCWSRARACLYHVPFQGGAPANTALLGGHIGYKFDVVSETAELHRGGKVRIIAVTGDKRDPQVPEVPTLKESGVNMVATAWFAMYGPAGLPQPVLAKLERAVSAAVKKPDMQAKMAGLGYDPIGSTRRRTGTAQRADLARWEKPIKATGFVQE